MRLDEINERMAAIKLELDAPDADLDALEAEVRSLKEEKAGIMDYAEKRKALVESVVEEKNAEVIHEFKEEKRVEKTYLNGTPEYREVFMKKLQGKSLDEIEERALTGGSGALPEQTANTIVAKLVDMVPLLNEIHLFRNPGNVTINVNTVMPGATLEAAGGAVTESNATLVEVSLGGYNMNAFLSIGADLSIMAIPAFEAWLVDELARAIAYKIEYYIINGDGNSAPKGIEKYVATWDVSDGNAVDWAGATLAVTDLDKAIGLIPAAYDRESKFLMSKKTFYNNVANLTDVNNFPVVQREGNKFLIRGYEVIFSDQVAANDIFFGSFRAGMVGNLGVDIRVEKQRNLRYNSWDFLGWGVFDCKPKQTGCIVKIADDIQA